MSAALYINSRGKSVTYHSYSASQDFHTCARKYYLKKVMGWREKVYGAGAEHGKAVELGVRTLHLTGQIHLALKAFHDEWAKSKEKKLRYSKTEKTWENLDAVGDDLIRLYHVIYPTLPYIVENPKKDMQLETTFEVFPGSRLAGIKFTSYIDYLGKMKDTGETIIIDQKVAGNELPELELIELDPQLRSYVWALSQAGVKKGCSLVALLWLRKMSRDIDRGDTVTMLNPWNGLGIGVEVTVLDKDPNGSLWVTRDAQIVDGVKARAGKKKADEVIRRKYIEDYSLNVPANLVTKQRIEFGWARVTPESASDIGQSIKQDIVHIVAATENNFFPMQSGIRFPHDVCSMCEMRGICINKPELRDALVERKDGDDFED